MCHCNGRLNPSSSAEYYSRLLYSMPGVIMVADMAGTRGKSGPKQGSGTTIKPERQKKKSGSSFFTYRKLLFLIFTVLSAVFAGKYFVHTDTFKQLQNDANFDWIIEHKNLFPNSMFNDVINFINANGTSETQLSNSFAVGQALKSEGFKPKHPVILVPGVISTTLENWGLEGTAECPSKPHYRKPMWGGWYMLKTMLTDKHCWLQHVMLDRETGLDPANITVRSMKGVDAADFFITGYWIWNKVIENLSALGYEPNDMHLAAYDWRLGYPDLQRRDGYFRELKNLIESSYLHTGEKTILAGHSMGSQVIFYFLKWAEAEGHGNGGPNWCDTYIESIIDISGSVLGTPKASTSIISGEMKDTVMLNKLAIYGLEKFFSRHERREMLLTWPGIASMLPKGGNAVWGDFSGAPDDTNSSVAHYGTFGNFLRFTEPVSNYSDHNLTMHETFKYLNDISPSHWSDRTNSMYSYGLAKTAKQVQENEKDPRTWSNPLEVALPNAPNMKWHCFYGVGNPTERAYNYKDSTHDNITPLNVTMDFENENAVIMGEGDGTVSLLTHSMCHIWKQEGSKFNPGNVQVKIVEMLHEPDSFDLRGGAKTAEHVDILGRTELNELVLKVAAGHSDDIEERQISDLAKYVAKFDLGTN